MKIRLRRGQTTSSKWWRRTSILGCWSVFPLGDRLWTREDLTWHPDRAFVPSWGGTASAVALLWSSVAKAPVSEYQWFFFTWGPRQFNSLWFFLEESSSTLNLWSISSKVFVKFLNMHDNWPWIGSRRKRATWMFRPSRTRWESCCSRC